ncbi:MAG: hypothetical protein JNJ56_03090 [Ignavibacteria bacterium]|nr:hypothetical protein [Ignavibacteria bacterium]
MIPEFKNLNDKEIDLLINAPVLLTILISSADGNIEQKEVNWGAKTTHFRAEDKESILQKYYEKVDKHSREAFFHIMEKLPVETEGKIYFISNELKKLNNILPKLNKEFAKELYKSYLSLAKQVAQASGGIWGYGSISREEQRLLDLEIINPPHQ